MWSVPVTATLSSAASLLGGVSVNHAPSPLAPGENSRLFYRSGKRRRLGVAPFLKVLPWYAFGPVQLVIVGVVLGR
jgi:hypothetical protein